MYNIDDLSFYLFQQKEKQENLCHSIRDERVELFSVQKVRKL